MSDKRVKRIETAADVATLPILIMQRAVIYTGKSAATLRRAVDRGELKRAGRLGPKGTWTFKRSELDRWLSGK